MPASHGKGQALEVRGLNKRYGDSAALRGIDLQVPAGALYGLVGANGAGKTTFIKCLLDFCDADAGTIRIFQVPSEVSASRRPVAFLPERFTPPYYLTGEDFLRFMMQMYERTYDRRGAEEMSAALDLPPQALRQPVRTYSKGMTQKLGLTACLLSGRALLVLDEPTSGLDPRARALLKSQIRGLCNTGTSFLLTSHNLADVDELCDEMAVLHEGELRFAGTPAELKQRHHANGLEQAYLACIA
jgi:ABC-2 type transport system ATP-binding protein